MAFHISREVGSASVSVTPMKMTLTTVVLALVLSGCAASGSTQVGSTPGVSTPTTDPQPTASESSASTVPRVENLAGVIGLAWTGTDSDGDLNIIAFGEDGSVTTTQMGEVTTDPSDIWTIEGDVLAFTIDYGQDIGVASYTATFDAESQTLAAEYTTTTGATGSVDLVRTTY